MTEISLQNDLSISVTSFVPLNLLHSDSHIDLSFLNLVMKGIKFFCATAIMTGLSLVSRPTNLLYSSHNWPIDLLGILGVPNDAVVLVTIGL